MDFRILGPVEVWHEGEQVPISAPRQLAVLVSLLTRAGSVVSTGTIVEDLWGATPPRSASVTVRNYVQRLRKALPLPVLDSTPPGYRLRVSPEQLDVHRFDALAGRARVEPDDTRAAELFAEALRLWRSPPLLGIGDPPLRTLQAPKLEELYLGALEDSFDVRLRLGEHTELVAALTELTAEYPLRERLRRQLMIALYRTGRAAEALGHYRRIRAELIEELGMEPGSELRKLEQAILREDPELATPDRGRDEPGRAHVPDALPSGSSTFVGRADELRGMLARFTEPGPAPTVCFVHGPGGAGKSTLAIRAAHELAERFPDGVLYADLRGSTPGAAARSPAEVLQVLIRTLGGADVDPRQELATIIRAYRTRLRGRRVLVLLDNAADAAQVLPAIPDQAGCGAIVTSRTLISGPDDAARVHLDAFEQEDALELLRRIAGAPKVDAEPAEAAELVTLCGRLPLALRLIATRVALRPHWPLRSWVELLADERQRLDQLRHQDADVRASFGVSIEGLRAEGALDADLLFTKLGMVDVDGHTVGLASALTGWPAERAEGALEHLVGAGLLYSPAPGRYAMYDLIVLLARERAGAVPAVERTETLGRAVRWYLATVRQCSELATGARSMHGMCQDDPVDSLETPRFGGYEAARSWLDSEIGTLVELLCQAARDRPAGLSAAMTTFARILSWYFNSSMRWTERSLFGEAILTLAHATGEQRLEALGLSHLCVTEAQRGNLAEAERLGSRAARLLDGTTPTDHDRLMLRINQAGVAMLRGDVEQAIALNEPVLDLAAEAGYRHLVSSTLGNLAMIHAKTGRLGEAASLLRDAADINRTIGHVTGLAVNLNSLMDVHSALGEHHEVVACSTDALPLHAKLGSGYLAAECLLNLAGSLRELGRLTEAGERYQQARRHLTTISTRERIKLASLLDQFDAS